MRHQITALSVLAFTLLILIGCDSNNKTVANTEIEVANEEVIAEGFQIMESNCFSCHSAKSDFSQQIAPPMAAIKKHYLADETTLNDFSNDLWEFVNAPEVAKSKMPGAIEKFGLMPKMPLSKEQTKSIASYLYHTEIEAPEWFEQHYQAEQKRHRKQKGKQHEDINYLVLGKEFALSTKAVLGKNLLGAIKEKGTSGAVDFCNTKAISLTDSMALALNARIKRVSDLPRNPSNRATGAALDYILKAKNQLKETGSISPNLIEIDGKKTAFYPILTNEMCMQCHGTPDVQIKEEALNTIAELYPDDEAKGYDINELRGIWVVEMDEE